MSEGIVRVRRREADGLVVVGSFAPSTLEVFMVDPDQLSANVATAQRKSYRNLTAVMLDGWSPEQPHRFRTAASDDPFNDAAYGSGVRGPTPTAVFVDEVPIHGYHFGHRPTRRAPERLVWWDEDEWTFKEGGE